MLDPAAIHALEARLRAQGVPASRDVPLSKLGFWRIGGPADLSVQATSNAQLSATLSAAQALGVPVSVLGKGSNLLVADAGVRGLVLRLEGAFRESGPDPAVPGTWVCGGGLPNTVLLQRLKRAGQGGLACLAGVPGTVGGAVRMNAGWSLGELSDVLVQVELALPDGSLHTVPASALDLRYRRATLPPGALVTRAWVRLLQDPAAVAQEAKNVAQYLARRKATQPLDQPSCGSVFKNPPGDAAGRLIDTAGLKGARQGGAQISTKHANFIVNTGGATAMDVYGLIRTARNTVHAHHGVVLEPEVHAVGDWPEGHWPLPPPSAVAPSPASPA